MRKQKLSPQEGDARSLVLNVSEAGAKETIEDAELFQLADLAPLALENLAIAIAVERKRRRIGGSISIGLEVRGWFGGEPMPDEPAPAPEREEPGDDMNEPPLTHRALNPEVIEACITAVDKAAQDYATEWASIRACLDAASLIADGSHVVQTAAHRATLRCLLTEALDREYTLTGSCDAVGGPLNVEDWPPPYNAREELLASVAADAPRREALQKRANDLARLHRGETPSELPPLHLHWTDLEVWDENCDGGRIVHPGTVRVWLRELREGLPTIFSQGSRVAFRTASGEVVAVGLNHELIHIGGPGLPGPLTIDWEGFDGRPRPPEGSEESLAAERERNVTAVSTATKQNRPEGNQS